MQVTKGWSLLSCSFALLCASACGSVTGDKPGVDGNTINPNGDFTLTVDPTSLTIPIASSAKVTVTVHRTDLTGDIALSATGLGSNLTADFSPASIPDGSETSEVTITVKGGTAAGASTVKITGTLGDKTHSADVSVTSTTITVSGTVRGGRAGIKVGLIGKTAQTSGAGGIFTFTDVTPPYDLYTFENFSCGGNNTPTVYYFDDLTIADPIVTAASPCPPLTFIFCGIFGNPCPASSVTGTKSGSGNNSDPVVWAWTGGSFNNPVLNSNGSFSGSASWGSGTTNQGFLHALQLTRKANGAPNTFLGYARSASTTLTNGQAATINLNFTTVNSVATVTGTLMNPTGYPAPSVTMWQQFGTSQKSLWDAQTTAIDAAFPTGLALAGGTNLYAVSSLNGGTSYYVQPLTATDTVNFTMPEAAVAGQPAENATGVTTATPFDWTAPSNVVTEVFLNSGTTAAFHIFTTATQMTIPVIPELPLPSQKTFQWSINGYGPNSDVNDAVGANELETVSSGDFAGPAHAWTLAPARSFTTQ